jgi:hypothetical protein
MTTFNTLLERLKALELAALMGESVRGFEDVIEILNKEQMKIGQDADGADLYNYRSPDYAEYKQNNGSKAPFGVADFYETGAFFSGISVELTDSLIIFNSADEKTADLEKKSNDRMFGLNSDSRTEFISEYLLESFVDAAKMKLRL